MTDEIRDQEDFNDSAIAIVGMAGRFPDARDADAFWRNIRDGRESIQAYTDEELEDAGVPAALLANPNYVKVGVEFPDMEKFDAGFFGFSPLDASLMDPQHRHFLECCWEVLENSGTDPSRFAGSIAVYAGSGHNAYMSRNLLTNPDLVEQVGFFLIRHTGNDKDFLATRVSYQFDLRGPSVNVQTACSTSLVAVHFACQSLLSGECDMALAGGVTIELPHRRGYLAREGEILSPDGHCRPFDASSNGTLFGSACGALALRRLEDAIEDGHTILAVIRGSAINNDGAGKIGYLAPSVDGQAGAITEAIEIADVDPATIGMIEAHGTGTAIGDPIEIAALSQAYGQGAGPATCAVGSVKSNIGHTDTAAGVASIIKAVQALRHRELPGTLHFESPNPEIRLEATPFYVTQQTLPWPAGSTPRRAGVSSLGVGGTNAHVILEEAPEESASAAAGRATQLIVISARSATALENASERLAEHLRAHPEINLADVAFTLANGRKSFEQRQVLAAATPEEAVRRLDARQWHRGVSPTQPIRRITFLLPGGGAQYPNMGRDLYEAESVYREQVERLFGSLAPDVARNLRSLLMPEVGAEVAAAAEMQRPSIQLPLIFITEFALAQLWRSWGLEPESLLGHSMGENTAACLSGVMTPEEALALVSLRGRLFEKVDEGGMLSVAMSAEEVKPLLDSELCIASINAPELCVVSGSLEAISSLSKLLEEREISTQRIQINVAAHSSMLDPILDEWLEFLSGLDLKAPQIPFVSNITGTWIRDEEATDPAYWARHLRGAVRFSDGVALLLEDKDRGLLEVGPGRTLSTLAGMQAGPQRSVLNSMRHPDDDASDLHRVLETLGQLWISGYSVDWKALQGDDERRRIQLPSYAFDHERYWIEPGQSLYEEGETGETLERSEHLADWFYTPGWKRAPLTGQLDTSGAVLVLRDGSALSRSVIDGLEAAGRKVIEVEAGTQYSNRDANLFCVRPAHNEDYERVLDVLAKQDRLPSSVLHLWCSDGSSGSAQGAKAARRELDLGFGAVLSLVQAIGTQDLSGPLDLFVVTTGAQQVGGEATLDPLRALMLGQCRVVRNEFSNLSCRVIDLESVPVDSDIGSQQIALLLSELSATSNALALSYRGGLRFAETFERTPLPEPGPNSGLRDEGVYLITGGLGGLGLSLAEHLARTRRAKLVLVGRHAAPPREEWNHWIAMRPEQDRARQRLETLIRIEELGGEILIEAGDVSDTARMCEVVETAKRHFGALHGVFHTAGVLDDQLAQIKTLDDAKKVLAPKVFGTLALAEATRSLDLDFMILYSSVSALAGLPGQIDYAAASCFLDAFARYHSRTTSTQTVSIAWGPWREVGMAAQLARGDASELGFDLTHPLLERFDGQGTQGERYSTRFSVDKHWLLDEHRLGTGEALIPGTGYLELATAALESRSEGGSIELRDVFLASPFLVPDGKERTLHLDLQREEGTFIFWSSLEEGGPRLEHVRGAIGYAGANVGEDSTPVSIAALQARCSRSERVYDGVPLQRHLRFGPRWGCLKRVDFGNREALAELQMPPNFCEELDSMKLHPALLDMASGAAHALLPDFDPDREFCVPMSYSRVISHRSLPANLYAHLVDRSDPASADSYGIFDVVLLDTEGVELARFDEFVVKRVAGTETLALSDDTLYADAEDVSEEMERAGAPPMIEQAINTAEGLAALERILGINGVDQIAVLPHDLDAWIEIVSAPLLAPAGFKATSSISPELQTELEETSQILIENEAVSDCAVTAHFDRPGQKRLLAHLVWNPDCHATFSELRRYLRERLPDDRLPQNFVDLEELPRRSDGSVDVDALEDPYGIADDYVAPRSDVEKIIAKIWQETLGIDRVGLHDNFFDIGGHSLLAMRTILRMEKRIGVRLNNAIMVLQTLEQIAAECVKRQPELGDESATETLGMVAEDASDAKSQGLASRFLRAMKRGTDTDSR